MNPKIIQCINHSIIFRIKRRIASLWEKQQQEVESYFTDLRQTGRAIWYQPSSLKAWLGIPMMVLTFALLAIYCIFCLLGMCLAVLSAPWERYQCIKCVERDFTSELRLKNVWYYCGLKSKMTEQALSLLGVMIETLYGFKPDMVDIADRLAVIELRYSPTRKVNAIARGDDLPAMHCFTPSSLDILLREISANLPTVPVHTQDRG